MMKYDGSNLRPPRRLAIKARAAAAICQKPPTLLRGFSQGARTYSKCLPSRPASTSSLLSSPALVEFHRVVARFGCAHRSAQCRRRWPGQSRCPPLETFSAVSELVEALRKFKQLYNHRWLIERHGFQPPARVGREFAGSAKAVAWRFISGRRRRRLRDGERTAFDARLAWTSPRWDNQPNSAARLWRACRRRPRLTSSPSR
jgi:hypothetical protein